MVRVFSVAVHLVLVALATGATVREPLAVDWCTTRTNGFYQDPFDCERFVRCVGGIKYEFDCPPGTRWDSVITTCNFPTETTCNTTNFIQPEVTPAPPFCPPDVSDGNQRDSSNCGRYFNCKNGVSVLKACRQEEYFNPLWGVCTPFNSLSQADQDFCNALTTPTPTPTTPSLPFCPTEVLDANQRDATNCRKYIRCRSGVADLEDCPVGLYFNTVWATCTPFSSLTQTDKDYCNGLTTASPTTQEPPVSCPDGVTNGVSRDINDCGRYYLCNSGVLTSVACPSGQYFNTVWRACSAFSALSVEDKALCSGLTTATPTTPTPPFCPPEVDNGNQRDPTNCGRYYNCRRGVSTLQACNQENYFNTIWAACSPYNALSQEDKDFCDSLTNPEPPICPSSLGEGLQRDPQDCNRFYRCVNGDAFRLNCPAGAYFTNSVSQPCGRFEDMDATDQGYCAALEAERATDPSVVCVSNVPIGFMRDAKNCSQYYWCVNGVPYLRKCASDLYYSTFLQACSVFEDMSSTDQAYCTALTTPAPTPPVVCPDTLFAFIQHPTDCSKYYQCRAGVPEEVFCVSGTYYSPLTFRCDPAAQLSRNRYDECIGGTTTAAPATVVCNGINQGRLMDFFDQNCRRYYECVLGQRTTTNDVRVCPVGSYFNVVNKLCTTFENLPPTFQQYCNRV